MVQKRDEDKIQLQDVDRFEDGDTLEINCMWLMLFDSVLFCNVKSSSGKGSMVACVTMGTRAEMRYKPDTRAGRES